ncbi:MAG: hypothetical protein J6O04_07105 [Selenomonadaceae bacterium]|nr:hypothetical protein [Selenomonadaceae bacterium]
MENNPMEYRRLWGKDLSNEERVELLKNYGSQQGYKHNTDRVGSFGSLTQGYSQDTKSGGSAYYAHPIVELRTLTKSETWFFENKGFISPHFCVQVLYKVKGYVTRTDLNRAIYKLVEENPNLRAGYCKMPTRALKVVFKDRQIPLIYQNVNRMSGESIQKSLDRLIEKDRLEGFDLLHGPLFRISIFHTQEGGDDNDEEVYSGEYAILVTESHLIMDFWNPFQFLSDTFGGGIAGQVQGESKRLLFTDALIAQDADRAINTKTYWMASLADGYWKNFLKDLPTAVNLPGHRSHGATATRQEVVHRSVSDEDIKLLGEKINRNKSVDTALLQLAWGLYLQNENHTDDSWFCVLMAEPSMKAGTAAKFAALLRPVFARIKCGDKQEITIGDLVTAQLQQMLTSQSFSWLYMEDILNYLHIEKEAFSHFLSFHGFLSGNLLYEEVFALPQGASVSMESWDSDGIDLGIYFRYDGDSIETTFRYQPDAFKIGSVEQMVLDYHTLIHIMLADWDKPLKDFWIDYNKTQRKKKSHELSQIKAQKAFSFMRNLDMFRAIKEETLWIFANSAEFYTCQRDSQLPPSNSVFMFLMWGVIERYLVFPNGVKEKLDRVRDKCWFNENIALEEDAKASITLSIVNSPVMLMTVPFRVIRNETEVFDYLHERAFEAMETYLTK